MTSPDLTAANIDKLAELFPKVITETPDAEGNPKKGVDFDLLRQELSDHVVEGPQERYRLDWPGKREAAFAANAPIAKALRPIREESVDFDTTKNLFIEGDNLEALKLLQESYLGKVKLIYIDPPYNTGNDFVYADDFAESTAAYLERSCQTDPDGSRLVANPESNGRFHSNWLNMMYPRLKLARNLLTNDGAIFISIGDNEQDNLKKLCNEVFGETNLIAVVPRIAKRTSDKGTHFRPTKDYILAYARNISILPEFGISKERNEGDYRLTEGDGRRYKKSGASLYQPSLDSRPNQRYYIEAPDGSLIIPPGTVFPEEKRDGAKVKPVSNSDKVWRWSRDTYLEQKDLLIFTKGSDRNPLLDENGKQSKWNVYPKVYYDEDVESTLHPEDVIYDYPNSQATKELLSLNIPFSFAKPTGLIVFLLKLLNDDQMIVLDFFAGSATTAHAVMQMNADDGGRRSFIMVQIDEKPDPKSDAAKAGFNTIAEISRERIRRAGARVVDESGLAANQLDVGFRSLKIDTTNLSDVLSPPDETRQAELIRLVNSIKADRSGEDLLFQVLLDWGLEVTMKINVEQIDEHEVFVVEDDALVACFDSAVSPEVVRAIAKREPLRAVFRDSGFASDDARINAEQIFREISPATDVKAI
jgi:adenine-specific DNA-methyltransferase